MSAAMPAVSVVIPTIGRPALLLRAVASVLGQTMADLELIVVVDGMDAASLAALDGVGDARLTVIANAVSRGAAGARNMGAGLARGAWLAFLDDDDVWLPEKLARQMAFAQGRAPALYTCLNRVISPIARYVWPETIFGNDVAFDDYLFDRRRAFSGAAFIQTSGYFLPRDLFLSAPFSENSPHDDWEFAIRLAKQSGVRIETVPDVLVELYVEEARPSLSSKARWRASRDWVDAMRPLLTRRSYSGICLGVVGPRAASEGAVEAFFPLLFRAFRHGAPRPVHVAAYLAFWLVPAGLRRRLRARLRKSRAV
jgi:glycosyltransferase involved in cell wall biosynthesis